MSTRVADLLALAFICLYFAAWFADGVFGGRSYVSEDVLGFFYASRSQLYEMAHGRGFSWWDPLVGLGMPRLGNIQNGILSPISLLFYLLPTAEALRFHGALVSSLLAAFCYLLFRARDLPPLAALAGALAWSTTGTIVDHVQHMPVLETLLWIPFTLLCWERWRRSGTPLWIPAAAAGVAFMCFGGSPQYVMYGGLIIAVWIGIDLWRSRGDLGAGSRLVAAVAAVASGTLLATWQVLPMLELTALAHRTLLAGTDFADTFRAAPWEVLLALCGESFWLGPAPSMAYAPAYPNQPNLSVVTVLLALVTLWRPPRPWLEWTAAGLFLVMMLGSASVVLPAVQGLVPALGLVRAPIRMIVPAAFFLSWLAAWGASRLPGPRLALSAAACAWLAAAGWALQHRQEQMWVERSVFAVPPAFTAAKDRVSVLFQASRPVPSFAFDAGVVAGRSTLFMREVIWTRNFLEAAFASQFGGLERVELLSAVIGNNFLPLLKPELPLLRAFGLNSVIRYRDGYQLTTLPRPMDRFWMVAAGHVVERRDHRLRLASDTRWNPRLEAILDAPLAAFPVEEEERSRARREGDAYRYGEVQVLADEADSQVLEVTSKGGLLVVSGLMYPGWEPSVDGVRVEAVEADLALRAVPVPAGTHRVSWRYRPTWLGLALGSTILAAVLLAGWVLLTPRRRRDPIAE